MKNLREDSEGNLSFEGKPVKAERVGKSRVLWHVQGYEEIDKFSLAGIMRRFAKGVVPKGDRVSDAYLEGIPLVQGGKVYTPVQFYITETVA